MDENADNYDEKANTADGKCLYTKAETVTKKVKYKTKYKFNFFII